MNSTIGLESFDLSGKVAVVTGGTGILGGAIATGLARAGAKVAVIGRRKRVGATVVEIIRELGGNAEAIVADVLDPASLREARSTLEQSWGRVDVLLNCAGGNVPEATVINERTFFDLETEALRQVVDLNCMEPSSHHRSSAN
jgi:NAD(P)-dependent dehydrogenase (short-subunit alcohol dehydrogenase family)